MALDKAHKGYEYQDLLTAVFILEEILNDANATFIIDRKEGGNDKFDDISIIKPEKTIKRQVKYSEDKILAKADLSSARCDLAVDTLFISWKERRNVNSDYRLCLAWEYIEDDEELGFLSDISCDNIYGSSNVRFLKVNINKIWTEGDKPNISWSRLREKSENINRTEFSSFLDNLIIEVNLPKSSHDLFEPGTLEKIAFDKLRKFGIGKYPNDHITIEDVLAKLLIIIKSARANGLKLTLDEIVYKIGAKKTFGNIEQKFSIDSNVNVTNAQKYRDYYQQIKHSPKNVLIGAPGSGKSWFTQNLIDYFENNDIGYVRHYCYTGMGDTHEKDRITINVFLANLMNDILTRYPHLYYEKETKYGVDINELQTIINCIDEETVIIIDGLDHISRVYSLHKDIMKKVDTEIINVISRLEVPTPVKVLLVSQPINDVLELSNKGFVIGEIKHWDIEEVRMLMALYEVDDVRLRWEFNLSDMLLSRSNGNPLYLTYILRELSKYVSEMITIDLIEGFPEYDDDLGKYYSYLMEKIPEENKIPQVLSGAPFYLNEQELGEITHLGKYVHDTIDTISSVLEFNGSNGGYIIYHESFRRFIVDLLESNGVDVTVVIYRDLIDWLVNKGFYTERKSYLNLLQLLYESNRYDEILQYCSKEFIVESMFYGNNIQSIEKNYEILMKAACKKKDYGKVIVCTEISNMINGLEYSFDENAELYYQCIGRVNGFDKLNDLLIYDGHMSLSLLIGLRVCYLCSIHNVIPYWKPYIEKFIQVYNSNEKPSWSNEEQLELYKYYICANIDLAYNITNLLTQINAEQAFEERRIVLEEFSRRGEINELRKIIESIENNDAWIKDIETFINDDTQEVQSLKQVFDTLKNADENRADTAEALEIYTKCIKWIVENRLTELKVFTIGISNRNWFYNWLIFIADINTIIINGIEEPDFEDKLIKAYEILILDTEVFKGKPRTCDLYSYRKIIYKTILNPLKYIRSNEKWKIVLGIIQTMSTDTMTSLDGSTCGPLTTDKLFSMFLEVANEKNIDFIIDLINKRTEEEKGKRYYTYLADYSFKCAYLLSAANKIDAAKDSLKQGIIYILSYTFRKDRTLSRLLDSVGTTVINDKEKGINNILKLKTLADAVVNHTDGRSTKRYQKEWFEVLVEHDITIGLSHLINILPHYRCHWIFEGCLKAALIECNGIVAPEIEIALYKTLPNCKEQSFISSYLDTIEVLFKKGNEIQAIRSLKELICRFNVDDKDKITDTALLERMKVLAEANNIDWNYDEYLRRAIAEKKDYKYNDMEKQNKDITCSRKSFDSCTYDEVLTYIGNNGIRPSEYQGLFYFFQGIEDLNEQSKRFVNALVKIFIEDPFDRIRKEKFIELVESLELSDKLKSYLYMQIYLKHQDGWLKKFTRSDLFAKACSYSQEIAEEAFFTYVYNNMSTVDYSFAVGDQIINSLGKAGHDPKLLQQYWDSLFDIINFRLSGQYEYDWKAVFAKTIDWNNSERLFAILLARLKFAESSRCKWIFSELSYLLSFANMRRLFIKSLMWFLNNINEYIDYIVSIILEFVVTHYKAEEIEEFGIREVLTNIYPTQKPTIDFIIRKVLNRGKSRIYVEYSHKTLSARTNYFVKRMRWIDSRINKFEEYGLDIGNVIDKYLNDIISRDMVNKYQELIYDRSHEVLLPNLYFYDLLSKYFSEEIEIFLSSHAGNYLTDGLENELYKILMDDIPLVIGENNSLDIRPNDLLFPENITEGKQEIEDKDWIRIASYEKCYHKRKRFYGKYHESIHNTMVFSGVVFNENLTSIPHLYVGTDYRLYSENQDIRYPKSYMKSIEKIIVSDLSLMDDVYWTYIIRQYLGIRADVLSCLGIRMGEHIEGIVGFTNNGEVVLRYSRWVKNLGDVDSDSYSIPYLLGAQLELRSDKFKELCKLINKKPYYYSCKHISEE